MPKINVLNGLAFSSGWDTIMVTFDKSLYMWLFFLVMNHVGHDSYNIHLISLGCLCPIIALQGRIVAWKKGHSFNFIKWNQLCLLPTQLPYNNICKQYTYESITLYLLVFRGQPQQSYYVLGCCSTSEANKPASGAWLIQNFHLISLGWFKHILFQQWKRIGWGKNATWVVLHTVIP